MRVVHIVTRFLKAGAEENILLTCNGQAALGHEVHLIYGRDYSPDMCRRLSPEIRQHCVASLVRNIHPWHDLKAYLDMTRLLKELNGDIIHTHTSKAGVIGRMAAKKAGAPCIIHGVHMLAFTSVSHLQRFVYLTMERIAAKVTDCFINVGSGTLEESLAYGIGTREHHYIVPSGMDIRRFQNARPPADWRELIPTDKVAPASPKFIILVGALEPRKQQIPFLSAFKNVANACPEAVLLLVGEGEEEARIREHIVSEGLTGHAVMLGFRDDVERLIALSTVGVLPSLREGLARVVIQYTLCGIPVVCTHTPGVEAIVKDGANGYLVPVDRLEQMTPKLIALLTDSDLHDRMSAAARAVDLSAWSAEHMVSKTKKIYNNYKSID